MRFIFQVAAIFVICLILELLLPWWSVAIGAAIGGYVLHSRANFVAGFLGVGLLWFMMALWIDRNAATTLPTQVAKIFMLPSSSMLIGVLTIIGGMVGGFGALTGSFLVKNRT